MCMWLCTETFSRIHTQHTQARTIAEFRVWTMCTVDKHRDVCSHRSGPMLLTAAVILLRSTWKKTTMNKGPGVAPNKKAENYMYV